MTDKWVSIFTTSAFECKWCLAAKELLNCYGIDYYEKDLVNEEHLKEFKELGHKSVPQSYLEVKGTLPTLIGGHDDLKMWLRANHNSKAMYEKKAADYGF